MWGDEVLEMRASAKRGDVTNKGASSLGLFSCTPMRTVLPSRPLANRLALTPST